MQMGRLDWCGLACSSLGFRQPLVRAKRPYQGVTAVAVILSYED